MTPTLHCLMQPRPKGLGFFVLDGLECIKGHEGPNVKDFPLSVPPCLIGHSISCAP